MTTTSEGNVDMASRIGNLDKASTPMALPRIEVAYEERAQDMEATWMVGHVLQ